MVGFMESANLPMIGIVHFAPGRCDFLYRYTDCSSASNVKTTATEVQSHVEDFDVEFNSEGMGKDPNEATADEGCAVMAWL